MNPLQHKGRTEWLQQEYGAENIYFLALCSRWLGPGQDAQGLGVQNLIKERLQVKTLGEVRLGSRTSALMTPLIPEEALPQPRALYMVTIMSL